MSFVVNLSNVFLVQLPNFSLSFSLLIQWLYLLLVWYNRTFQVPHPYFVVAVIIIIIIIIIIIVINCN